MGYRELFLVLFGGMLFSLLMTQINTNIVEGREALQELELEHTAAAVAQQFIEEAKAKDFDGQVGVISASLMPGSFTSPLSLGLEIGEFYPNFSDVDDYHGLDRTVGVQGVPFQVKIEVAYVQDADPEAKVLVPTFFKKMTVTVSSSYLQHSVTLEHIFTFFGMDL